LWTKSEKKVKLTHAFFLSMLQVNCIEKRCYTFMEIFFVLTYIGFSFVDDYIAYTTNRNATILRNLTEHFSFRTRHGINSNNSFLIQSCQMIKMIHFIILIHMIWTIWRRKPVPIDLFKVIKYRNNCANAFNTFIVIIHLILSSCIWIEHKNSWISKLENWKLWHLYDINNIVLFILY